MRACLRSTGLAQRCGVGAVEDRRDIAERRRIDDLERDALLAGALLDVRPNAGHPFFVLHSLPRSGHPGLTLPLPLCVTALDRLRIGVDTADPWSFAAL